MSLELDMAAILYFLLAFTTVVPMEPVEGMPPEYQMGFAAQYESDVLMASNVPVLVEKSNGIRNITVCCSQQMRRCPEPHRYPPRMRRG